MSFDEIFDLTAGGSVFSFFIQNMYGTSCVWLSMSSGSFYVRKGGPWGVVAMIASEGIRNMRESENASFYIILWMLHDVVPKWLRFGHKLKGYGS